jgi:hypothetical protein
MGLNESFETWWASYWTPTGQPPVFDLAMKEIAWSAVLFSTHRYTEIGALVLGDVYSNEVGEWDTDLEQAIIDKINETRDPSIKRIKVFVLVE